MRLHDAIVDLQKLQDENAQLATGFQATDFDNSDLQHLTVALMTDLFTVVVPSMDSWFKDQGGNNKNKKTVLQIRK